MNLTEENKTGLVEVENKNIADNLLLEACENKIRNGINYVLKGSTQIGGALKEIQEKKLYSLNHHTFEMYCQKVWNLSKQRAYQLIQQCNVVLNLSTMVDKFDVNSTNERQIRELAKYQPEEQIEIWKAVLHETEEKKIKPTAKLIQEKANEFIGKKEDSSNLKINNPDLEKSYFNDLSEEQKMDDLIRESGPIDIYEAIEIAEKKPEVEKIEIPTQESKIIEINKKIAEPKLFIPKNVIQTSLKVIGLSKADFAVQDPNTSDFIPSKNFENTKVDFSGKGIINFLSDDIAKISLLEFFEKIEDGSVIEFILFYKADFSSNWFKVFSGCSQAYCALNLNEPFPIMAFYSGNNADKFATKFQHLGRVMTTYAIPQAN